MRAPFWFCTLPKFGAGTQINNPNLKLVCVFQPFLMLHTNKHEMWTQVIEWNIITDSIFLME